MKKDIEKKNEFIHFLEKWLIIGMVLFVLVQLFAITVINLTIPEENRITEEQYETYNKDYIGHWYDGTFFINMTVKENFESEEKYDEMVKAIDNNTISTICGHSGKVVALAIVILVVIAAIKEKKKKLLEGETPIIIILAGISILLFKFIEETDLFIDSTYWSKYSKGFLSTASYYPMFYNIFIIGTLLILLGLIFRQKQRKDLKLDTKNNEKIIKTICILILTIGLGFTFYRFGIRVYELAMTLLNKDINIRLPFYYFIFDLPKSFATSSSSYTKIVVLRFIKDLPVFISSALSIVLFTKIINTSIKGDILSKENNKRYKIIFISMIISSIILNLLGLLEVNIYNNEFSYQYKEAVYTIAIRSLCEPLLYVFFIYIFKHYIELAFTTNKSKK